jgi:hypothetical protein
MISGIRVDPDRNFDAGHEIEVRGLDLLEFFQDGKIKRKHSFWKILE